MADPFIRVTFPNAEGHKRIVTYDKVEVVLTPGKALADLKEAILNMHADDEDDEVRIDISPCMYRLVVDDKVGEVATLLLTVIGFDVIGIPAEVTTQVTADRPLTEETT